MTEARGETAPPTAPIPSRPVREPVHCGSSWRQLQIDASRLGLAQGDRRRLSAKAFERRRITLLSWLEVVDGGDQVAAGRQAAHGEAPLLVRTRGSDGKRPRRPSVHVLSEGDGYIVG